MKPIISGRSVLSILFALALGAAAWAQSETPILIVANNVSDDLSTFRIGPDGSLEFVERISSSEGPLSIDISPDGRFVAVGHGTENDVMETLNVFAINADATLRLAFAGTTPDSPLDVVWLDNTTICATRTSLNATNTVEVYKWDPAAETYSGLDSEQTGVFNSGLANGNGFLFASDTFGNQIFRFQVTAGGELDPLGVTSTGSLFGLGPGLSPDGDSLYAGGGISGGGNAILGWSVDAAGDLTPLPGAPFSSPGESPKVARVSEDGRILFVGHGTDSTVRSFVIEDDGSPLPSDSFDVGSQGTLGDIATLGEFIFITDESTVSDGIRGVYSSKFDPDGMLTQVDFEDPGGVRPEMMAAWAPASDPCPADLDGDGAVGSSDLAILLGAWGASGPGDFDGGGVGSADLAILLGAWGPCP